MIDDLEEFFDQAGHWKMGPRAPVEWAAEPRAVLEQKEFWEVLQRCLSSLPTRIADAFSLRELDGLQSEAICKVLGISTTNLWVMLHRARFGLRRCLEVHWFGDKAARKAG